MSLDPTFVTIIGVWSVAFRDINEEFEFVHIVLGDQMASVFLEEPT